MTTLYKIIIGVLIALLLTATASALYFFYKKPATITVTEYLPAKPIPQAAHIKPVKVPGPKEVVTLDKPTLLQKIELPQSFKDNPNEQALATAQIPPYKGTTNAVAVMNVKEGTTVILAKQVPLPLFGFINDRRIGVRGGMGIQNGIEGTVYGSWSFVRAFGANVGIYGEGTMNGIGSINTQTNAKAQIQLEWQW